jgi:hypothetical protein
MSQYMQFHILSTFNGITQHGNRISEHLIVVLFLLALVRDDNTNARTEAI